jgi:glc operon protein GlcG
MRCLLVKEQSEILLVYTTSNLSDAGAQVAIAGAAQEARRNGWRVCIAVVDAAGNLLAFRRMDGTAVASILGAQEKARSAAHTNRPTAEFQKAIDSGRPSYLGIHWITSLEGGVPILVGDTVVGAIGTSGVEAHQDAQVSLAGAAAITISLRG